MKLPKEIIIFGELVAVKVVAEIPDVDRDCIGLFKYSEKAIYIKKGLKRDVRLHTFLHEYFHAVVAVLGLQNTQLSHDLEEVIVDNFAKSIADNFILRKR